MADGWAQVRPTWDIFRRRAVATPDGKPLRGGPGVAASGLSFLKLPRTESVAVIAIAEGKPVTFLEHVSLCTKIETVLYEGPRSPAGAGDSNDTLVTLVAAISDPNGIPIRCDEDAQAVWSRFVAWRNVFLKRVLQRKLPLLGYLRPSSQMR